jgi:malate synthase
VTPQDSPVAVSVASEHVTLVNDDGPEGERDMAVDPQIQILGDAGGKRADVLTADALAFIGKLHRNFNSQRKELLSARTDRQAAIDRGESLGFPESTSDIRADQWKVASAPADLQDRRVEITGPVDRKMIINALNSGARVFMADFEDATSPAWSNIIEGQINLIEAIRRTIELQNPDGRLYTLNDAIATLIVRPRGWHLPENHVLVDGEPVSGSLFDFGLYFFHNAQELLDRGSGPYYYLPKLESHLEARLWNEVFTFAQKELGVPHGTIRATVLIETITAALEMDEILYELRDHASGLNAGRWDYIFSAIKKFRTRDDTLLPDRVQVTMTVPFMRAYTEHLVRTCHHRGAHAMGGMAAFIPSRDPAINDVAMNNVKADKEREAGDGFDGTWVAHPALIPIAEKAFDAVLGDRPNQKERLRDDVSISANEILAVGVPGGTITEAGVRGNISVALQYINAWLLGTGAAAINNLMEDAATAEIARAQIWQWIRHGGTLDNGTRITADLYNTIHAEELAALGGADNQRFGDASALLDKLILNDEFIEFLTLPALEYLERTN